MNHRQQALVDQAVRLAGPKAVTINPDDIAPWLVDWRRRYSGNAPAILAPATTEETAAIVRAAVELQVALVPQGGNTSMVGGATPPADGTALILSLRRLNRIRAINRDEGQAIVEAGVVLEALHEAALDHDMRFPLTLGARGSATLGGLVSTNAGGTQVLRFGTMRRLVTGVEAVLPDGSIHDGLSALKKDCRGYDLNQLLIGAEGTLGVVTAAALTLVPAIGARTVAWIGVASPHAALTLLRRFQQNLPSVESFEIIPDDSLGLVLEHIPQTRAPLAGSHRWHVLVEATADVGQSAPLAPIEQLLGGALEDGLIEDAVIAASESQASAFWRLRDSLSEAERASGPAVQHDISVPVAAMPDFMVQAAAKVEARFAGVSASAFGHLGDGNVHFHVRAAAGEDRDAWYRDRAPAITTLVHDLVTEAGGSISAEHGIGQMKRDELARLGPPARLAALRAIKYALDPAGIMNPGKLIAN